MVQLINLEIFRGEFREEEIFLLFCIVSRSFKGNNVFFLGNGEEFGVVEVYG